MRRTRTRTRTRTPRQYYFHPMDSIPIYNEDGEEISTSRVTCMKCIETQKNSDIRRIIQQCRDSLTRREIARQTIINRAYAMFGINESYRYKNEVYTCPDDLYLVDGVEYIDQHQYDGFRHTDYNIASCEAIITDRITNPYYVFFFYPTINMDPIYTSQYERIFHSSHPTGEEALDTILQNVSRATEGTLEAKKIYFILYFGDNRDDGELVWNQSVPLLE